MSDTRHSGTGPPGPRDYSTELLEAVVTALPGWVEHTIRRAMNGAVVDETAMRSEIAASSASMIAAIRKSLGELLGRDPEQQRSNPLQVLRAEASVVTESLHRLGARPVVRDEFERTSMPDDVFGVGPLAWRDLGEQVHEAGITWGAWKAATVMSRHAADGRTR